MRGRFLEGAERLLLALSSLLTLDELSRGYTDVRRESGTSRVAIVMMGNPRWRFLPLT